MAHPVDAETVLEDVLAFLAHPPEPGGADDARFRERLSQVISASIPLVDGDDPQDAPALQLDDALRERLEQALRERRRNYFGDHPDGIGPTLGMDVGKA
ncbi:MAG: hypothetical protein ACOVMT_00250 [Caulobacter sp.]